MRKTLTGANHDSTAVLFKVLDLFLDTLQFSQKSDLLLIDNSLPRCEIGKLFQYRSFLCLSFL